MELSIEKFSPTVAELNNIVKVASRIVVTDINDKSQMEEVRQYRIVIRDTRVAITKRGKELRGDALKFQKAVIEKERELIAIIEPEETRLKAIEDEVKAKKLRAERIELEPERLSRLIEIGDDVELSRNELLDMDASEFQAHVNKRVADKNEADRLALKEKEDKLAETENKQKQEAQTRKREEKARKEEKERIESEQKEEREKEEKRKKEEKKRLESEERFQSYVKKIGFVNESTDYHTHEEKGVVYFFKKIGELSVEDK